MYMNKKNQTKWQKIFLIVLVIMLSVGLLLPSFLSLFSGAMY